VQKQVGQVGIKAQDIRKARKLERQEIMGISNNDPDDFEEQWEEDAIEEAIEDAAIEEDMKRQDAEIKMEYYNG